MIAKQNMDALIVANIFGLVSRSEVLDFLAPFSGIPIVMLSEKIQGIPSVLIDNAAGFRNLLHYLIDRCNSRSFAVITGPKSNFDSNERMDVLMETLSKCSLKIDTKNIYEGDFSGLSALAGIKTLLDERKARFDTLVCFNDLMAATSMEELKRRGYRIPEDVKITGFDNTYESEYTDPPLTPVNIPMSELCKTAVDKIHEMLTGRRVNEQTVLPTSFRPRLSSGTVHSILSVLTDIRERYRSRNTIHKLIAREYKGKYLLQLGEELETASISMPCLPYWKNTLALSASKPALSLCLPIHP